MGYSHNLIRVRRFRAFCYEVQFQATRSFLAAAHFQNITRAAESLAMSQSAASSALKELENQFDIQLFDRVGKRLQLNELGRLYRPKVEAVLAQATELEQAFSKHTEVGALKVGATLTIGNYLAVGVMAQYMNTPTQPRVSLEVANTSTIARRVKDFELDIGLIEGELQSSELDVLPWRGDQLVVFCSPTHPLAAKKELSDADLRDATWVMRARFRNSAKLRARHARPAPKPERTAGTGAHRSHQASRGS